MTLTASKSVENLFGRQSGAPSRQSVKLAQKVRLGKIFRFRVAGFFGLLGSYLVARVDFSRRTPS